MTPEKVDYVRQKVIKNLREAEKELKRGFPTSAGLHYQTATQLQNSLDTLNTQLAEAKKRAEANKLPTIVQYITENKPILRRELVTNPAVYLQARYPDPDAIVGVRQVQTPIYQLSIRPEDQDQINTIQAQINEVSEQLRLKTNEFNEAAQNAVSGLASMLENAIEPDKPHQPNLVSVGVPTGVIVGGAIVLYLLSKK